MRFYFFFAQQWNNIAFCYGMLYLCLVLFNTVSLQWYNIFSMWILDITLYQLVFRYNFKEAIDYLSIPMDY